MTTFNHSIYFNIDKKSSILHNSGNANLATNNLNYEVLGSESAKSSIKLNGDFHLIQSEDYILLNKKTNDIYFKNVAGKNKENFVLNPETNVAFGQLDAGFKSAVSETPLRDRNESNLKQELTLKAGSSSGSTKKNKKKKVNMTPKSKVKTKLKASSKSSKSLKKSNYNFTSVKKTHAEAASLDKPADEYEHADTRQHASKSAENSQTQSIKLIKENFANLFLSKKSHSNNHESNSTSESSSLSRQSVKGLLPPPSIKISDDTELLKAIEIETNKNLKQSETTG